MKIFLIILLQEEKEIIKKNIIKKVKIHQKKCERIIQVIKRSIIENKKIRYSKINIYK